jgi:hypothetical protein
MVALEKNVIRNWVLLGDNNELETWVLLAK